MWVTSNVNQVCLLRLTRVNLLFERIMSTWRTWYNTSCVLSRIFCWLSSKSLFPPLPSGCPCAFGTCAAWWQFQSHYGNGLLENTSIWLSKGAIMCVSITIWILDFSCTYNNLFCLCRRTICSTLQRRRQFTNYFVCCIIGLADTYHLTAKRKYVWG